jgi:KipI family sensor histidine kinase inhibitor
MSEGSGFRIQPLGERAVLVTLGDRPDPGPNRSARAVAAAIDAHRAGDPRLGRAVPAAASVLIPFDPLTLDWAEAARIVGDLVTAATSRPAGDDGASTIAADRTPIEIAVRYGGPDGPDLADVAESHGLRPADIVELHTGSSWTALFLGFAPGFAYLGPLPPTLATSRLATPRVSVPAGSVAIGGDQTAVYPFSMPGGWRVIGRTERAMWDLRRDQPNLIGPGDQVRFVPLR